MNKEIKPLKTEGTNIYMDILKMINNTCTMFTQIMYNQQEILKELNELKKEVKQQNEETE